jgi:hypothetical protein
VVAGHRLLHVLGQVVPQVPPVGHLDRRRRAGAGAMGVAAGAVSADHRHTRVLAQPGRERVGFPVWQQVDRMMGVQVDQYGAVAVAAPQREVVHAQHLHLACWRVGQSAYQPQHGVAADPKPQPGGESGTGSAGQRQPQPLEYLPGWSAAPRVPHGQAGHLLGEGHCRTVGGIAEPAAYV